MNSEAGGWGEGRV